MTHGGRSKYSIDDSHFNSKLFIGYTAVRQLLKAQTLVHQMPTSVQTPQRVNFQL